MAGLVEGGSKSRLLCHINRFDVLRLGFLTEIERNTGRTKDHGPCKLLCVFVAEHCIHRQKARSLSMR